MDIALFDFDGTVTDREMFVAFLEHAVESRRLALSKAVLAPLAVGYKLGIVQGNFIRAAAVRFGLTGTTVEAIEGRAETFGSSILPDVIRPVALDRIRWHQERGDTVAVVTGALEVALRPWCKTQGIDLIGSVLQQENDRFTGRYAQPQCLREHKVSRVRERYDLGSYEAVHVYGDTPDDFAMLSLATHGYYKWQEYRAGANNSFKPKPLRGST